MFFFAGRKAYGAVAPAAHVARGLQLSIIDQDVNTLGDVLRFVGFFVEGGIIKDFGYEHGGLLRLFGGGGKDEVVKGRGGHAWGFRFV